MRSPMVSCGPCQESAPVAANAVCVSIGDVCTPLVETRMPCCGRTVTVEVSLTTWWHIRRLLVQFVEAEVRAFRRSLDRAGVEAATLIGGTDG